MATPLLMVHASGLGARSLDRLSARLVGAGQPAYPMDLPGYPDCPTPERPPLLGDCEAVEAEARRLGQPLLLFGHSYGGCVALEVARRGRIRLLGLVVYEPVVVSLLRGTEPGRRWTPQASLAFVSLADGPEAFLERLVDYWSGAGAWRSMPSGWRAGQLARAGRIQAEVRQLMVDDLGGETLQAVDCPTLVIRGQHGHVDVVASTEALVALLPSAELAIVAAGHMGPVTHSGLVSDALERVLARWRKAERSLV
ncbi:MAG: pimeloyl-ACP methyl ester carboxylesterase [Myxococcota bacterium]|jgi:pimeloyl-ACP methyl ester carboxylesterase